MNIEIKNCNNIDLGVIGIQPKKLNIKLGINGTGKSTIARSLTLSVDEEDLSSLKPFKHENDKTDEYTPAVSGLDEIGSVKVFNEEYVTQFVFKPEELVENSFEIFIKTPAYTQKMEAINALIGDAKKVFQEHEWLAQAIKDFDQLAADMRTTAAGALAGNSKMSKAFGGNGNILENIPDELSSYTNYLKSNSNVKWLKWQAQGNAFLDLDSGCPYCIAPTEENKERIKKVSEVYNSKTVENLGAIIDVIEKLGDYFSTSTVSTLEGIVKKIEGLNEAEELFLVTLKQQAEALSNHLKKIQNLSNFDFKDKDRAEEEINALKIDISLYQYLNSEKTQQVVASVDASITEVVDKIGLLKGQIAQQERLVKDAIENNQKEINGFLSYAGYKYEVELLGEKNDIKLRLRHTDGTKAVQNGDQHLSYGERNAFAVILFMYECLAQSPDLIILDDPISSFDKNKKFSILHKLFRGSNSLKSKTVLLLTHDVEPVIDTVKIMPDKFAEFTVASYLRNRNGSLTEETISYGDVLSFKQVCDAVRETHPNKLIRLIYLRRYFDILDDKGMEYQMLSSLFKKASTPYIKNGDDEVDFTSEQKSEVEGKVSELVGGFSYDELLAVIGDNTQIVAAYRQAENGYEKVQIFRLLEAEHEDHVVRKHISETFHIENDLVFQLSPQKYDPVPDFLIDTCDQYIDENHTQG
ncbi:MULTISPECIES: AAA family ATPase [unclassified Lentimonas]|uniref:AAA family ATPase n=1 Tax=unclassified Lentimonas TaxID=2630993 RepID=UPI001328128C|nr:MULTISPECIES: AAA family ATPase [unclassified Lentimonas]CAA6677374.1 FIG00241420: hypothetical protein [Lentimonas sp. CC4]CAA6686919.1 FIG00241420: hypothetical protein [Lentimonas sp. CC6]CAA6690102.1 FIG00241420: hypothetical protein [Lentimonas sp. CC19]CAA6690936.1 FIG00241420: hypothetical protein [Lentimonas sp. CC10]CAA7070712.1 FIG00241420: hypothetical protein [Lentimonas sp. CC11]